MTLTEDMGDLLYDHAHEKPRIAKKCLALAQKIFMVVSSHVKAMRCMGEQNRVRQALEYGQKVSIEGLLDLQKHGGLLTA